MEGKRMLSFVLLQLMIVLVASIGVNNNNNNNNNNKFIPARPVIPDTFHAKVRASLINSSMPPSTSQDSWLGGGYIALDTERGFKSAMLHMKPLGHNRASDVHVHLLDRYDMQSSFTVYYNRSCLTKEVSGTVPHPFEWVKHAVFAGTSTYNGHVLENWEYKDVNNAQYKVAVKKGTSVPVFFVLGTQIVSSPELRLELTVIEWSERVRPRILSFVPINCGAHDPTQMLGDVNAVVAFADANWDCADVACSQTVPSGTGQPGYACAEFTARSLAAGGYISGLGAYDDQGSYSGYNYGGNTYNLIDCSGLSPALTALGFSSEAPQASSVNAGCSAIGNGGDGDFSHAVIGVGPGIDDAHNNARYHWDVSGSLYLGIDAVQCAPGVTPGSSTGTYYSYKDEKVKEDEGGKGQAIYTKQPKNAATESIIERDTVPVDQSVHLVEEKVTSKF